MRKNIFRIIVVITLYQCTSQKENEYFDRRYKKISAKFFKIEEKENIKIYHFKNSKIQGVFAKEKSCIINTNSWKEIKLNKTYNLLLHKPINVNLRSKGIIESLNGEFVWDSDMKSIFFDNCLNVCGNKVYEIK